MDILGIGFPELIVILIIAMMVFGPRRLPEMAGKAGKIIRDLRGMSQGLLLEWQREINVASRLDELTEIRHELELTKQELGNTTREIGQQTKSSVEQIKQDVASIPASVTQAAQDVADDGLAAAATATPGEPAASSSDGEVIEGQPDPPAVDGNRAPPDPEVEGISFEDRTIEPRPQVVRAKSSELAEPDSGSTQDTAPPSESYPKLEASLSSQPDEPAVSQTAESGTVEKNGKGVSAGGSKEPKHGSAESPPSELSSKPEEVTNE